MIMWFRSVSMAFAISLSPALAQEARPDPFSPLTCLLQPSRSSQIGSDHIGLIRSVNVRRADRVKQGDVLVVLDPAVIEAEIALNQVSIDSLRARLARSQSLAERRLIPAEEIEQLRTDLRVAEATLARTRIVLDRTLIRAPFDGVIADVMVSEGELTGNEPLLRLTETSEIRVEMVFIDAAFGRISIGQHVALSLPLTGDTVTATISAIDPFLDPSSNTFLVSARLDNAEGKIPVGLGCDLTGWAG